MVNNNDMYFSHDNNLNDFSGFSGGCCMQQQGSYSPYNPMYQGYYMRANNPIYPSYNQPYNGCPYVMSNMQYSPAVNCFNSAGIPSMRDSEEHIGYINPFQLNMRIVSIEEITE